MKNETSLRKWLRQVLPSGITCFTQPGLGGTVGQPDVLVIVQPTGLLAPIELKVAQALPSGNLRPLRLQPVQIAWHARHAQVGGRSFLLLGVPGEGASSWDCWLLTDCSHGILSGWKKGFPPYQLFRVAHDGKLASDAWWGALKS